MARYWPTADRDARARITYEILSEPVRVHDSGAGKPPGTRSNPRQDASVTFSTDSAFSTDATQVRVVARVDGGVVDADGVAVIDVNG